MPIDIARVRQDTRACDTVIHLNNAGASLPPAIVMDTVHEQLRADEVFGGYEAQALAAEPLENAHAAVAELIGGATEEVAFFDGATRAWQTALYSLPWKRGDRILASEAEYPSNVYAFSHLKDRHGVKTVFIPDDEKGQIDVDALRDAIDERTRLITLTHIPTYGGLINPAARVGEVARKAGVPFLLDACQSVGHLHLDVDDLGCDILTSAGRKYLRGPRGTGFMWARSSIIETMRPAFADNNSAPWTAPDSFELRAGAARFETFERSAALHLGLGAAARYATKIGTEAIEPRVSLLAATLRGMLSEIPAVTIRDRGERLGGIVTFTVEGFTAEDVRVALREHHINTSITVAGYAQRSFPALGLEEVNRASVHYYNTEDELARTVEVVRDLVG